MTQKVAKRIESLHKATEKYSTRVDKRLASSPRGSARSAMRESAAKYFVALKKLAEK